jgi:hypothetical protein
MSARDGFGKIRRTESNASMSGESLFKSAPIGAGMTSGGVRCPHDPAWRTIFAAALRVIDHHRANLDARMTIQRMRSEEPRHAPDPDNASGHG